MPIVTFDVANRSDRADSRTTRATNGWEKSELQGISQELRPGQRTMLRSTCNHTGSGMSKPSEPAGNPKMSRAPKTVAPETGRTGALQIAQNQSLEASSADLSPWKNRFMSALLDKLGVNGKPDATSSNGRDSRSSDSGQSLFRGSTPSSVQSRDDWLGETQVGDSSARPMTFTYPPGSTPLPRYTIRRGIGMGGFGEVYFAVSDAGKEVALKRIQRNLEVELRGVSHCLNLKHPNLVALYDICRDDHDQYWVVMEYVAGPNLRQVLDESPAGLAGRGSSALVRSDRIGSRPSSLGRTGSSRSEARQRV